MNALTLYETPERYDIRRWILASIVIVVLHACLLAAIAFWRQNQTTPGAFAPPILIDLSPVSASPEKHELDLAPGPLMQQADAPAEPPKTQQQVEEAIPPAPPQQNPIVTAPPEQVTKPSHESAKPKPVPEAKKKNSDKPPAPKTTAAPKAERQAPLANAAASGAAAATAASYRATLAAHLQRFKQYPAASRSAGQQGIATLSFTINRSGHVLGSRIARSSGHPALDADTLALLQRAQPLPAFPAEITQTSMSFTVPMAYTLR